tara:strand:- start:524 stop:1540 length:1017 start_codon:yes stop_codon:yes gene_type:complete
MKSDFKEYINLAFNDELDKESAQTAFKLIMNGEVNEIQISSFLSLLQKSGIKSHHIIAALDVMKTKMVKIRSPQGSMDTCGTGGDGKNSLNISTATAFVLAAKGIPVAKHGNRALTSRCGSADVLQELKINVDMEASKIEECLEKVGICFMFAPNHHPAMKYVGKVRQNLGIRTIFNMLGPLMNPAGVKNQIVGVYSKEVFDIYKHVFEKDLEKKICLISGYDGNDEVSLDGKNLIFTKDDGLLEFDPQSIDLPKSIPNEVLGGDALYNSKRILEIFNGTKDSFYNTVCLNTAFAITLNNSKEINNQNILNAFEESKLLISSGLPLKIIENLIEFTNK